MYVCGNIVVMAGMLYVCLCECGIVLKGSDMFVCGDQFIIRRFLTGVPVGTIQ